MNYKFFFPRLLVDSLLLVCLASFAFGAKRLSPDEVQALEDIGKTLGKTWNLSVELRWTRPPDNRYMNNVIGGNCSTASSTTTDQICHVTNILLKGQNLQGQLPLELIRLPYLQEIDLTRNYLSGTIPPEWDSLPLVNISLDSNRLNGSIPPELGNITTLKSLAIDFNKFTGVLPAELGNLSSIENMFLTSNNFTGDLPETFAKLTTLKDFRISDSSFSGKIPNFFQNWINLEALVIQASGFTGPIPSGISHLTKLIELIITDLNGSESLFPQLDNMKSLERLILRNCNISGHLPKYLGNTTNLKILDLSFNKLTGDIPNNLTRRTDLDYLFLTGNMLTGSVPPDWKKAKSTDLSYNNFTLNSEDEACKPRDDELNLFASSSGGNTSSVSCLPITECPITYYDLHINCGGKEVVLYDNFRRVTRPDATYEDDTDAAGPSSVYRSPMRYWASSTTGYFVDNLTHTYISTNSSGLSMTNPELYMNARLSPISLTYYGFCLGNGIYTVNLHFAEIIFTNDKTYSSLGRRVFDIYIQGTLVQKDFNIADEAGGFGKAVVKNFTANVTSNTLEIRLYWAGKGTTGVPYGGDYGPLISAISIVSDFDPPQGGISAGAVVGIVAGGVFIILLILGILWRKGFIGPAKTLEQGEKFNWRIKVVIGAIIAGIGFLLSAILFSIKHWISEIRENNNKDAEAFIQNIGPIAVKRYKFSDVRKMTNSFKDKLGQGGYGDVYKGMLLTGCHVAVKVLKASKGNGEDFVNEVASISRTSHVNVVTLLGYCFEGKKKALIYEFMPNGSLEKFIYKDSSPLKTTPHLELERLFQIATGIARGLEYLHRGCNTRILHFDIKPHNILLDENFCPKISDFGLSKLCTRKESIISMLDARGTIGYIAPEVCCRNFGGVSAKSDVYSYGMMILEMVGGRKNVDARVSHTSEIYFPDWVYERLEQGSNFGLLNAVTEEEKEIARKMILVGLWCIQTNPYDRPSTSRVIEMLEGSIEDLQIPPKAILSSPVRSSPPDLPLYQH